MEKKKKKFAVPNVFIILFGIILVCSILSYIIPAGTYEMMDLDGRSVGDPDSYHNIEQTPVSAMQMLTSITRGLQESAQIVFFLFIVGGAMAVIQSTGALEAGIGKLAKSLNGKDLIIIPIVLFLFGIGGAIFGMCEEAVPLVPLFVALCLAMGYDSMVGMAIVMVGGAMGWRVYESVLSAGRPGNRRTAAAFGHGAKNCTVYCITSRNLPVDYALCQKSEKESTAFADV